MFPVVHLKLDGACFSLRPHPLEPTAPSCIACLFDTKFQGVGKEPERIEQGALSHAVFADHRCHGGKRLAIRLVPQAAQRNVFEHFEVFYSQSLLS